MHWAKIARAAAGLTDADLLKSCDGACATLAFTGERVVPQAVEPQLWNEHISRYRFASIFTPGKRVLDIGCGTGYGAELLGASSQSALGIDISGEAIQYARQRFKRPRFLCASAASIPFAGESFDVITAFEVIEHLADWETMLSEAGRLLTLDGVFLVSTPNIEYYAESRGDSGPNPYHVHEFELSEFEFALGRVFPCVQILAQNQQENITFSGSTAAECCAAFVPPTSDVGGCHFFVAVCSFQPVSVPFFADVSSSHNLLRERERHINGLREELLDARRQYLEMEERNRLLAERNQSLSEEVDRARQCAWIRLGRMLGVGPWTDEPKAEVLPAAAPPRLARLWK